MLKYTVIILVLILGCDGKKQQKSGVKDFKLPINEGWSWIYDAKYIKSDLSNEINYTKKKLKITLLSSKIEGFYYHYHFDKPFNRRCDEGIIYNEIEGYKNNSEFDDNENNMFDSYYLLNFPIVSGAKWNNRIHKGFEEYEYTNIDTTLKVNGKSYQNCLEVSLKYRYHSWDETDTSMVKMYFNKKYGLVYYYDDLLEEEYKLIEVIKE